MKTILTFSRNKPPQKGDLENKCHSFAGFNANYNEALGVIELECGECPTTLAYIKLGYEKEEERND